MKLLKVIGGVASVRRRINTHGEKMDGPGESQVALRSQNRPREELPTLTIRYVG